LLDEQEDLLSTAESNDGMAEPDPDRDLVDADDGRAERPNSETTRVKNE
jgi:hypothetical protein